MRRVVFSIALLGSIATSEGPAPPPVAPEAPPRSTPKAEAPKVERSFVSASSLNLREAASSDAAVVSKLSIGTELVVDRTDGDWSHVSTGRGQQGWVGSAFLASTRLEYSEALRQTEIATDPKEKLAWAQRAAALHPIDTEALVVLEAAYRALGRNKEADQVATRMRDLGGPKYEAWFPAPVRADFDALRAEMDAVQTLDQFLAARTHALSLSRQGSDIIGAIWDPEEASFAGDPNADWLVPLLPGMALDWAPEGMGVGLVLELKPWAVIAKRTPSPSDDAFVTFMSTMYDNFEGTGWANWHERDWDFGGCNRFGGGKHLGALLASDSLVGSPFAEDVAKRRSHIVEDIVTDDTEFFPFCNHKGPSPKAELEAELASILKQVKLSEEERSKLLERQKRGWPNNP